MYPNTKLLRKKNFWGKKKLYCREYCAKWVTGVNPSGTCQLFNEKNGSWRRIVVITLILTIHSLISSALIAWKYLKNQTCCKCLLFSMLKSPSSFIFSSCVRCFNPLINCVTLYQAYSNISMFLAGGSPDFSTVEITFNQCWAEGKDLSPKPIGTTCPNVSDNAAHSLLSSGALALLRFIWLGCCLEQKPQPPVGYEDTGSVL